MPITVLITGASRGIGAEIAKSFARTGANVVINFASNEKLAQKVATEVFSLGGAPLVIKADVSKDSEAKMLVNKTLKVFGKIDVLVNNAGIASYGLLIDTSAEAIDKVIGINLKGTINVSKYVSLNMIQNQKGKIINISSMWGISGASNEAVYSASKSGVIGFTKALAKELGLSGITVNAIAPGVIRTDMLNSLSKEDLEELASQTSLGRIGEPKDVAGVVEFLASDKADYITGAVINVDGGF